MTTNKLNYSLIFLSIVLIVLLSFILFKVKNIISPSLYNRKTESYNVTNGSLIGLSILLIISIIFLTYYENKLRTEDPDYYEDTKRYIEYFFIAVSILFIGCLALCAYFGKDMYTENLTTTDSFFLYGSLGVGAIITGILVYKIVLIYEEKRVVGKASKSLSADCKNKRKGIDPKVAFEQDKMFIKEKSQKIKELKNSVSKNVDSLGNLKNLNLGEEEKQETIDKQIDIYDYENDIDNIIFNCYKGDKKKQEILIKIKNENIKNNE